MWIGLTGSMGSGKSSVAKLLQEFGYFVVDADTLAHEGLEPGSASFDSIVKKLGSSILQLDGEIDRRKLGQIIFAEPGLKSWLESLIHPIVQMKVQAKRKEWEKLGAKVAFYEVPLLFEKGLESQFDKIIVVWVSEKIQYQRLKSRNNWTDEEIYHRNQSQWPINKKLEKADYKINNDGTIEELRLQVQQLLKKLNI
jgi:dephospho-CoA kinase